MATTKHHVRSASGKTLGARIVALERDIDRACQHWTGTGEDFRAWAERRVSQAMATIGFNCYCNTPDENIGVAKS